MKRFSRFVGTEVVDFFLIATSPEADFAQIGIGPHFAGDFSLLLFTVFDWK